MLPACRTATFPRQCPATTGGGGCGERGPSADVDASEDGEVSSDRASLSGHHLGPGRGVSGREVQGRPACAPDPGSAACPAPHRL